MNELLDYFKKNVSVSNEMEKELKDIIKEKTLEKGEIILAENSLKKEHFFVVSGCLRSYYTTDLGKEHTIQFAIKNWWISDYFTLYTDNKSIVSVESLTNTKVLVIDRTKAEKLYRAYPPFETFQRKNFEKRIATLQKRILSLLSYSAAEKYSQFVNDYAEFEKIIPNYQIASYLGIAPESLSRIRKKEIKSNFLT